jgi:putative DNA methylase
LTAYRKKLIEVALPLEAINAESAREKSIRHGHPSTLHLWWARRPLAACRAVLFASLVDDPSALPEQFPTLELQEAERQRLFRIIEAMVKWENVNNEEVMEAARAEIMRSTGGNPPPVLDPFCGGGSIPLEAQRLGLEAHASDLNPVAVLITKALIEIPPKFANMPPVHPGDKMARTWKGAQGLADDVRYYGKWARDEAFKRIGHLYPSVQLPKERGGGRATVVAWLWARTVTCPNPACGARMPLVRSFALSTKKGKETWVEPLIDHEARTLCFRIKAGQLTVEAGASISIGTGYFKSNGKKEKATFRCVVCGHGPVRGEYIDKEACNNNMSAMPMAIVAEGTRGRVYLPFDDQQEIISHSTANQYLEASGLDLAALAAPCKGTFASNATGRRYGFHTFADYFTTRQLVTLATFSDLVVAARERVL